MTKNLKADKLLIADGLVRFEYRGRAAGSVTVAVRLVATPVVFATLVPNVEPTVAVATRALWVYVRNWYWCWYWCGVAPGLGNTA